jgi:hypothetical protein
MLIDKPSGALHNATASSSSDDCALCIHRTHPNFRFHLKSLIASSEFMLGAFLYTTGSKNYSTRTTIADLERCVFCGVSFSVANHAFHFNFNLLFTGSSKKKQNTSFVVP